VVESKNLGQVFCCFFPASFNGPLSYFDDLTKNFYKNWFQAVEDTDNVKPYIATRKDWKYNCQTGELLQ